MIVTITLEVPEPPAPPEGYAVTGYAVERDAGRSIPSNTLRAAAENWVREGTARSYLIATANVPSGSEAEEMYAEWDAETHQWGEWH